MNLNTNYDINTISELYTLNQSISSILAPQDINKQTSHLNITLFLIK